jgi:hypothetical protein
MWYTMRYQNQFLEVFEKIEMNCVAEIVFMYPIYSAIPQITAVSKCEQF